VVKSFAWSLSDNKFEESRKLDLEALNALNVGLEAIVSKAHREGINLRHLGRVHNAVIGENEAFLKRLLLTECVARCIKNIIRMALRNFMEKAKEAPGESFLEVVHEILRPVFYYRAPLPLCLRSDSNVLDSARLSVDTTSLLSGALVTFDQPVSATVSSWFCELTIESCASAGQIIRIGILGAPVTIFWS